MNIENLMENVQEFFTKQYKGVENSNSFLSFEPLGTVIDPEDFEHEQEEISELKATEQLSIMGDRLPQIGNMYLTNTSRLSDVYEELIESAEFSSIRITSEDKTKYRAKFAEVKSEVELKFEQGRKSSIATPEGQYLPIYGSPKKWYNPRGSFWAGKSFTAKTSKDTKVPKKGKPKKALIPLMWRPKLEASMQAVKQVQEPKSTKHTKKTVAVNVSKHSMMMKPKLMNIKTQPIVARTKAKAKFKSPNTIALSAKSIPIRVADSKKSRPPAKPLLANNLLLKDLSVLKHLHVAERVKLTNAMAQNNTAPAKPLHSNEFSMSFDYCIVNLHRPWFDSSLLHYRKLWFSLTHEQGYFSTGAKDETNNGVLKCIPTAMILIKDLTLRAAWTEEDKKNAKSSISLGIFNVNDSVFSGNDLVNPGIQIIGWMCEVMPQIPVLSDPNISGEAET